MIGCWIDAPYASHQDMKSHTVDFLSFGMGRVISGSNSKQKLSLTSSTESERDSISRQCAVLQVRLEYNDNKEWLKN